ncbi:hypothetical protein FKP32DRAFT_932380 [Trametes sanguinea]|nr:hypothetical protein FKP32DRAFT_932380 [Trametes sanguinea]
MVSIVLTLAIVPTARLQALCKYSPSQMQACVVPLELCEAIIDAIPSTIESLPVPYVEGTKWTRPYIMLLQERSTLWACSLTCRAWRRRAQNLLWMRPLLLLPENVPSFYEIIRGDAENHSSRQRDGLVLIRDRRNSTPLFASLTRMEYHACVFPDERYFFEIVWACCNLVQLKLSNSLFKQHLYSEAEIAKRLSRIREQRNTCQKLKFLSIYQTDIFMAYNAFIGTALGTSITVAEASQELDTIDTEPCERVVSPGIPTVLRLT